MKPKDIRNKKDLKKLSEQGIQIGGFSFNLKGSYVEITTYFTTLKIPCYILERFCAWYFENQE